MRVHGVIGDVSDRHVIFFDDEIITGGSVAEELKPSWARSQVCEGWMCAWHARS